MSDFQYNKAPITEAVVQFRSKNPINKKLNDKGLTKLEALYSKHNPQIRKTVEFDIHQSGEPRTKSSESIVNKFSSNDMTEQLIISENSFLISQLAPYCGWKNFEKRIEKDWKTWRKVVGFQEILSLGMRYINRIDMPIEGQLVHYEDYVTVYPAVPELLNPSLHHSVNLKVHFADIESELTLKSALVPSPVPNNLAILIDIDLIKQFSAPPQDDELFLALNNVRNKKNEVFEACIKSKARELFRQ